MRIFLFIILLASNLTAQVETGIDRFFKEEFVAALANKKVAIITNHTGVDSHFRSTIDLFVEHEGKYKVVALFCPEHGLRGSGYASEKIENAKGPNNLPLYSLHGDKRRPTEKMLEGIDVLVYDIQDIGVRAYTYETTLFYVMEEAARRGIEVILLDRPNPMGGMLVDGPMLEEKWRSFIGYINVPYCHGLTIGELALFFNEEYQIKCNLKVIPLRGWQRTMIFKETGLPWIPPSPQIPEPDTPFYSASTGLLGELGLVSVGIGYTLPFKIVGAPWIDAEKFAEQLNAQKLPGVHFVPFYYRPFFGSWQGKDCQGIKIMMTDSKTYKPLSVQFLIIGMLKTLYPHQFKKSFDNLKPSQKELFCKACGNRAFLDFVEKEKYIIWKMIEYQQSERESYLAKRKKYLLY